MSVMTPADFRNPNPVGMNGRPMGPLMPMQPDVQRQAVIDQLAPPTATAAPRSSAPGAAATTGGASPFARGGKTKQLPGAGTAGKIGNIAASAGTNVAAGLASTGLDVASNAGNLATGAGIGLGTNYLAGKLRDKEVMPTFGGAFGAYTDDLGRRFQGTGGGVASNAVKYAGYGANPALVGATGGLSVAAGALAGAVKGAITKHAKTAYSDFSVEDAAKAIKAQYQAELGREASDEEVMGHLIGQGWDPKGGDRWVGEQNLTGPQGVMAAIRSSPEARAFKETGVPATAREAVVDQLGAPPMDPSKRGASAADVPGSAPAPPLGTGTASADLSGRAGQGSAPTAPADAEAETGVGDTSAWDTDSYAAPQYVPPSAGAVPAGWDAEKWADPNHQTPKYGVGRILSNFPPTVEGLASALPDIQKAYPGTEFNGKDKLTIPGVGTIDVLEAAGLGGKAWRWDDGSGGGEASGGAPASGGGVGVTGEPGEGGDLLAQLQAEIDRITKGNAPRAQVLSQLGAEA